MALPVMMSSPSMRVKLGSSNKTWKASIVIHHRISFNHNYVDFRVSYCGILGLDLCCCFTQHQIKQYYYNQSYKKQVCCSNSSNSWWPSPRHPRDFCTHFFLDQHTPPHESLSHVQHNLHHNLEDRNLKTSYLNIVIHDAPHRAANVSSFATLLHHRDCIIITDHTEEKWMC